MPLPSALHVLLQDIFLARFGKRRPSKSANKMVGMLLGRIVQLRVPAHDLPVHLPEDLLEGAVVLVFEDPCVGQGLSVDQESLLEVTLLVVEQQELQLGLRAEPLRRDLVLDVDRLLLETILGEERLWIPRDVLFLLEEGADLVDHGIALRIRLPSLLHFRVEDPHHPVKQRVLRLNLSRLSRNITALQSVLIELPRLQVLRRGQRPVPFVELAHLLGPV